MLKVAIVFAVLLCLAVPAIAQEGSRIEIFGGYQYTRLLGNNFNGWDSAVTANVNNWFGVTADIGGSYRSIEENSPTTITNVQIDLSHYDFLFGPTFSYNRHRLKPFGHVLLGVTHLSSKVTSNLNSGGTFSTSDSNNAFSVALGGGLDVSIHRNLAVRLVQADYLLTRFAGESQNNARISTGLVLRF